MTRTQFELDDRFAVIDSTDISCHGGHGPRDIQIGRATAWLLDPANSTAVCAVLDPDDMQVATIDDGAVVWTPLADFAG